MNTHKLTVKAIRCMVILIFLVSYSKPKLLPPPLESLQLQKQQQQPPPEAIQSQPGEPQSQPYGQEPSPEEPHPRPIVPQNPLINDFEPCHGHPSGQAMTPSMHRALIAWSYNGLDFQRPDDRQKGLLMDQMSVPDAVVLPSGRILLYLVTGCRIVDGVQQGSNEIGVVVSDQGGEPGSWYFKNVNFIGLPEMYGTNPLDPNAVVLPDGNISLFTTVFWKIGESQKSAIAAFLSTDGGFTFTYRSIV